jgi:hypothetical protein
MKNELNNLKYISEIVKTNTEKNINVNRKIIRKDIKNKCYLSLNFNLIGPIFVIFNLVGIYQLIWLLKSTQKEMTMGLNSFLFNKARNISEYEIYVEHSFNHIPDFNLFFITSMIGNPVLQYFGYKIASFIYMLLNGVIFFLIKSHSFPNEYDFLKCVLIIIYFLLLFLSVGSITLFPHSIYFDGLRKYMKEYFKNRHNISFFFYLSLTEIPAYLINILINYILKINNFYNNLENYFICSIIIYLSFVVSSILVYIIYSCSFVNF